MAATVAEPLHLDSRESAAKVGRLFETYTERQNHALAVLDDPTLTRLERARLATRVLQVLAGYRGRKPRDGDAGRPSIPALSVSVMARRAEDIRALVGVDGPAAGMTDVEIKHEVATRLDLSWERLRQILTGELGGGAARRRAPSDRPSGRPRANAARTVSDETTPQAPATPTDASEPATDVAVAPQMAAAAADLVRETRAAKAARNSIEEPAPPQTMAEAWAAMRTRG